jgi:hypothetical protein
MLSFFPINDQPKTTRLMFDEETYLNPFRYEEGDYDRLTDEEEARLKRL